MVQECSGFQFSSFSSFTSLYWLPWTILRSLVFKLFSALWPQTATRLLASCHLQQAEHVLVKVCLHQPSFKAHNADHALHVQPSIRRSHQSSVEHASQALYSMFNQAKGNPTVHAPITFLPRLPRLVARLAGLKIKSIQQQGVFGALFTLLHVAHCLLLHLLCLLLHDRPL